MEKRRDANPTAGETRHREWEESKGDTAAFQNSTTGPQARMNLKGEGGGHNDGDKGRRGDQAQIILVTATIH